MKTLFALFLFSQLSWAQDMERLASQVHSHLSAQLLKARTDQDLAFVSNQIKNFSQDLQICQIQLHMPIASITACGPVIARAKTLGVNVAQVESLLRQHKAKAEITAYIKARSLPSGGTAFD